MGRLISQVRTTHRPFLFQQIPPLFVILMVNPGAFSESRRAFLANEKDAYATAVANDHVADTVADILRRYFKRYPISLPHKEEPSQEWLAQVDDDAADPEMEAPNADTMSTEAYASALIDYEARAKELRTRTEVSTISLNTFILILILAL